MGFHRSRTAQDRARLFRRWRGASICRVGEGADESQDDTIRDEPLVEFHVPPVQRRNEESEGMDFELEGFEARWLQERLLVLEEVAEGPCLLAKAAELCADSPPRMMPERTRHFGPGTTPSRFGRHEQRGRTAVSSGRAKHPLSHTMFASRTLCSRDLRGACRVGGRCHRFAPPRSAAPALSGDAPEAGRGSVAVPG